MALVAVGLSAWFSWRHIWLVMAAGSALVLLPCVPWLLRGHQDEHLIPERRAEADSGSGPKGEWGRRDVLKDLRFYFIMPVSLAPAFIATGFFFHMGHLVEAKGWSLAFFTGAYTLYTLFSITMTLLTGLVVDRVGAVRILPWHLAPMCLGLVALGSSDHWIVALVYMCMTGVTVGVRITIGGAIWAEIYGVENLGAIRSLATSFLVVSTALSPVVMGLDDRLRRERGEPRVHVPGLRGGVVGIERCISQDAAFIGADCVSARLCYLVRSMSSRRAMRLSACPTIDSRSAAPAFCLSVDEFAQRRHGLLVSAEPLLFPAPGVDQEIVVPAFGFGHHFVVPATGFRHGFGVLAIRVGRAYFRARRHDANSVVEQPEAAEGGEEVEIGCGEAQGFKFRHALSPREWVLWFC